MLLGMIQSEKLMMEEGEGQASGLQWDYLISRMIIDERGEGVGQMSFSGEM